MHSPIVLVMDDNVDVLEIIQSCLIDLGYQVLTATDGTVGLGIALRDRPDALIVDMMLPGMSGFQVLKQFRERCDAHTPVIMISANGDPSQRAYAHILGADVFLAKPFRLNELIERLGQLAPFPHRSPDVAQEMTAPVH